MIFPCAHCGKEIRTNGTREIGFDRVSWCRDCCLENMKTLLSVNGLWTYGCQLMIEQCGYTWWSENRLFIDAITPKYPLCPQCERIHP